MSVRVDKSPVINVTPNTKKCKLTRRAQCRDCHVKECNECWTLDDYGKLPERLRHLIYMVLLCWNRRKRDIHIPPKFVKAIILKCFVQINTPILKNFNPQPIGSGYLLDKNTGFLMTKMVPNFVVGKLKYNQVVPLESYDLGLAYVLNFNYKVPRT